MNMFSPSDAGRSVREEIDFFATVWDFRRTIKIPAASGTLGGVMFTESDAGRSL